MINTEIDTSKLEPGMKVKNYKELCELLGVKPTTGEAKKKQLNNFNKYFTYNRSGHAYIIKEILEKPVLFSTPIPRRDRRKKKPKNIYIKFVELILMQYLTNKSNNGKIESTKIEIFKLLGLVNYKFNVKTYENDFIRTYKDLPNINKNLQHVKSKAYKKMDSILHTALHSLSNKRIITTMPVYYIMLEDDYTHEAREGEIKTILQIEYEIMQELEVREYWEIFAKDLNNKFYERFNEEINEYGWKYVNRKIKIIFNNTIIVKEIKRTELELQKMLLNEEFVEYMKENATSCLPVEYITEDYLQQYDLIIKSFIAYLSSS